MRRGKSRIDKHKLGVLGERLHLVAVATNPEPKDFGTMSIDKMISLHPDVAGDLNESLATAARHAMLCALMCTSCADACAAEKMDMRQCIRSCLDCADVCEATSKLSVRRTGQNREALRAMLDVCVRICELCAEECSRYDHAHCKLCAEMCGECARDCRAAIPTIGLSRDS
jgi:hypothetical protein